MSICCDILGFCSCRTSGKGVSPSVSELSLRKFFLESNQTTSCYCSLREKAHCCFHLRSGIYSHVFLTSGPRRRLCLWDFYASSPWMNHYGPVSVSLPGDSGHCLFPMLVMGGPWGFCGDQTSSWVFCCLWYKDHLQGLQRLLCP